MAGIRDIAETGEFKVTFESNPRVKGAYTHFEVPFPRDLRETLAITAIASQVKSEHTDILEDQLLDPDPSLAAAGITGFFLPFVAEPQHYNFAAGNLALRWARPGGVFFATPVEIEASSMDDHLPLWIENPEFNPAQGWLDYNATSRILFQQKPIWHDLRVPADVRKLDGNYRCHLNALATGHKYLIDVYIKYARQ